MTKKQVKTKAKKQMAKIKNALKKVGEGKSVGDLNWVVVGDIAEIVSYYKLVLAGKFDAAANRQDFYIDTDIRERIDSSIYNFIAEIAEEKYENDKI